MSWQEYVDQHLMIELPHKGVLSSAAIVGLDGSVWAQSPAFPTLSASEHSNIVGGFTDANKLAGNGLYIGGAKYMVVAGDPGQVIRGKKGQGGVTIKKTTSALVFGIYDEPVQPGDCNIVIEGLGDYLAGQGI